MGAPAQGAGDAQAVDDAVAPAAVEPLLAVEGRDALLGRRDVLVLPGGAVALGVQDGRLRQPRLDPFAARGVGVPDDEPHDRDDALGRPSSAATWAGWLRSAPMYTVPRPSDSAATTAFCAASAASRNATTVVSR